MANKRFPADMADITADYAHMLVAKADGTVGWATPCLARSGQTPLTGALVTSGAINALTPNTGFFDFVAGSTRLATVGANTSTYGIIKVSQYSSDGALGRDAYTIDANGNNNWTGAGSFGGTVTAQGTILTSSREKKHVFGEFKEDAISQIAGLKLHKFAYRKHEVEILEPEVLDKFGKVKKAAKTREIELPSPESPEHIGLMYDEVSDNPDIATPTGEIKLHNLVFLLVRAIQQLTARLEELEKASKKK